MIDSTSLTSGENACVLTCDNNIGDVNRSVCVNKGVLFHRERDRRRFKRKRRKTLGIYVNASGVRECLAASESARRACAKCLVSIILPPTLSLALPVFLLYHHAVGFSYCSVFR